MAHGTEEVRACIVGALKFDGYRVDAAADQLELYAFMGLTLLDSLERPDLIMVQLDLRPKADVGGRNTQPGLRLLASLRRVGWKTPVILLDAPEEAMQSISTAYLEPFVIVPDARDLAAVTAALMVVSGDQRPLAS